MVARVVAPASATPATVSQIFFILFLLVFTEKCT
jgi:hypothetical protein